VPDDDDVQIVGWFLGLIVHDRIALLRMIKKTIQRGLR
jgi:hypothetical protein